MLATSGWFRSKKESVMWSSVPDFHPPECAATQFRAEKTDQVSAGLCGSASTWEKQQKHRLAWTFKKLPPPPFLMAGPSGQKENGAEPERSTQAEGICLSSKAPKTSPPPCRAPVKLGLFSKNNPPNLALLCCGRETEKPSSAESCTSMPTRGVTAFHKAPVGWDGAAG